MDDPYKILSVKKNAKPGTIEMAYRKLAKTHHPDRGGDQAEFQVIQDAYDLLRDPKRRKLYDETGETKAIPYDRLAVGLISRFFIDVYRNLIMNGGDVRTTNVINSLSDVIQGMIRNHAKNIEVLKKIRDQVEESLSRIKPKKTDDTRILDVVRMHLDAITNEMRQFEQEKLTGEIALKILADYSYKTDSLFSGSLASSTADR